MKKISSPSGDEYTDDLIARVSNSRKYRTLGIPDTTLRDLVEKAARVQPDPRDVEKSLRHKLHNLVAPYLGDPDYEIMRSGLDTLPRDLHSDKVKEWCLRVLTSHASTRERIPIQQDFYSVIFSVTGMPNVLADVACGLNPFALPWMNLPPQSRYFAYDLHKPRIDLLNAFFAHTRQPGSACHRDILVEPPDIEADVVFFFKEAHRFEQRERGASRSFINRLKTRWLLVSLPTVSLSRSRSMLESDRRLVREVCADRNWQVNELLFDNEIVFCIRMRQ